MELEHLDQLAAGAVLSRAVANGWVAIAVAAWGTLCCGLSRSPLSRVGRTWLWEFATSHGMTLSVPVYLWALGVVIQTIAAFDVITAGFSLPIIWADGIARFVALGFVLMFAATSFLIRGRHGQVFLRDTLGPLFAISAVFIHFFFFLVLTTPWGSLR